MYNLHRGKSDRMSSNSPSHQHHRRLSPEEEAKMKEQALMAQMILINFLEIKELDKQIKCSCFKSCLNFEEKSFEDSEKECLRNCASKITPFLNNAKAIYKENEQNFSNLEDQFLKSEAFFKPESFMKGKSR